MKRLIKAMNRFMSLEDMREAYPDMSEFVAEEIYKDGRDEVYSLCDYVSKYVNGPKDKNFIYEAVPYALDNLSESQIRTFLQLQANRKQKPKSGSACFDWINNFKDFDFDKISEDMLTLFFKTDFLYKLVNGVNKDIRESENLGETFYGNAKACNLVMDIANKYYGGSVEPESKDAYNLLTLCNIYFKTGDFKVTDVMYNVIDETNNTNISATLRKVMRTYLLDGGDPEKVEFAIKNCEQLKDPITRALLKSDDKAIINEVYDRMKSGEDINTALEQLLYNVMASKNNSKRFVKATSNPMLNLNALSEAVSKLQVCDDFYEVWDYYDTDDADNDLLDLLDNVTITFSDVLKAIADVKEYIKKNNK